MKTAPVNPPDYRHDTVLPLPPEVRAGAWAVDAACSGNPGPMEYQAIDLATGARVFHFGPLHGTNNIGEFLAIVHAQARTLPLYVHRTATVIRVYGGRGETLTTAVTRACGGRRKVNIQQKWGRQPAGTIIKYRKEKADFKQKLGRQSAGREAGN